MVLVREVVPDEWPTLRDIRLAALRDAPDASLYERCGFSLTGERQPLPSNEDLTEFAMSRTL